MPWKASRPMDVKLEFVTRLKRGERMTDLCEEFGISRQTGYEVSQRYELLGAEGLVPRSRAPKRIAHRTAPEIMELVVQERGAHPSWGAKKLKVIVERERGLQLPAPSTIQDLLKRRGLIVPRRRRRLVHRSSTLGLRVADGPNVVWGADYKGQFRLGDGTYCYPLTMTDLFSRYLLVCEGMTAIDEEAALEASAQAFTQYGLPEAIRSDNGFPFASQGLWGLTKLSVYWLRLGINHERIEPGHPEQNGSHERMHRTLKRETTRPAGANLLQQQERFYGFRQEFNTHRPHEALGQKTPAEVYPASARPLPKPLPEPEYPLHDDVMEVDRSGHIRVAGRTYFLCAALAGQRVGVREDDDGRWLVSFVSLDLGHIDPRTKTFERAETQA